MLSLSCTVPVYLAADCQLVSDEGRRQLRSATSGRVLLDEPTATMQTGVLQLKLWNSLPAEL